MNRYKGRGSRALLITVFWRMDIFAERVEKVRFNRSRRVVEAQIKWTSRFFCYKTMRYIQRTWVPVKSLTDDPDLILDSAAFNNFLRSDDFSTFHAVYANAFDFSAVQVAYDELRRQEREDVYDPRPHMNAVQDVMTEWAVAKQTTFPSLAEDGTCPICLVEFEQDDFVSVLPCQHVLCAGCFNKWPKCTVCK